MDGERVKVLRALTRFKESVETFMKVSLTEEGSLMALKGAAVWWYKRTVSVFNPQRRYRRGEPAEGRVLAEEEMKKVSLEEGMEILKVHGSIDPKASPGRWTPICVENEGKLVCVPVLTALLEVTLMKSLEEEGVGPLKFKEGEDIVGMNMPKASKNNGVVMGVIADFLVVSNCPQEMCGYRMKSLSKKMASRGTTIVGGAAGYSCSARVRRSSTMTGTMVIVSELKTNMSRAATWEGKRKRNSELYEDRYGSKAVKNRPRKEDFPRASDKVPNMEQLSVINNRLRQAKASVRRFANKLYPRLRTKAQKAFLNAAVKGNNVGSLTMLVKSFKAVPPTSTKNVVPPMSIAKEVPESIKDNRALFKWVSENFSRVKFLSKTAGGAKMAGTIYYRGFTSTRDVPLGYMDKISTGLEGSSSMEMEEAVCRTGDKVIKGGVKANPLLWIENPMEERDEGGNDLCMIGADPTGDSRKRIVLSLEAAEPSKRAESASLKDDLQKDIDEGRISQVNIVNVSTGEKQALNGEAGRSFCTGLNLDGSGEQMRRSPFLLYKSAGDAQKAKSSDKKENMEIETPHS